MVAEGMLWKKGHNKNPYTLKKDELAAEPPKGESNSNHRPNAKFNQHLSNQYFQESEKLSFKKSEFPEQRSANRNKQLHSLAQRSAAPRTLNTNIRSVLWLIILAVIAYVIQLWFLSPHIR